MSETCEFESLDEANEILGLMMRHWNTIAATLHKGESTCHSCWRMRTVSPSAMIGLAGFMRGMTCGHDGWVELLDDEQQVRAV